MVDLQQRIQGSFALGIRHPASRWASAEVASLRILSALGHCALSSKQSDSGSPSLIKATTTPCSAPSLLSGRGGLVSAPWQWQVQGEGRMAVPQQAHSLVCN